MARVGCASQVETTTGAICPFDAGPARELKEGESARARDGWLKVILDVAPNWVA